VDNEPVVLLTGSTPAWRGFIAGMTDGPDVRELQANLIVSGYARGLFSSITGHMDTSTVTAIERWQVAEGYPATGQITLGQVVFLPSAVLVGADNVAPGQGAAPGDVPYVATTTARTVTVPLNPNLPPVDVGQSVTILLPTDATTAGTVTAEGPVPPSATSGAGGSSNAGGSSQSQASAELTVTPDDPSATGTGSGVAVQVSLITQSAWHVLAVPVSALLALAGGGYGVEVAEPSGHHRLVGVTTGIFAGGRVEVTGAGIDQGTKVVVAQ
jgi:peptidoglycan hydrolase-like protein with peptidoglycan-binding domain